MNERPARFKHRYLGGEYVDAVRFNPAPDVLVWRAFDHDYTVRRDPQGAIWIGVPRRKPVGDEVYYASSARPGDWVLRRHVLEFFVWGNAQFHAAYAPITPTL